MRFALWGAWKLALVVGAIMAATALTDGAVLLIGHLLRAVGLWGL
jgi:hypothetical protein